MNKNSSEPPAQSGKEDKAGGDLPPSDSPPADILPRYAIDLLETVAFYDDDITAQETVKKVHARYAGEYFKGAPDALRTAAKAILDTVNQVIKREIAFEDAKATIDGILSQ